MGKECCREEQSYEVSLVYSTVFYCKASWDTTYRVAGIPKHRWCFQIFRVYLPSCFRSPAMSVRRLTTVTRGGGGAGRSARLTATFTDVSAGASHWCQDAGCLRQLRWSILPVCYLETSNPFSAVGWFGDFVSFSFVVWRRIGSRTFKTGSRCSCRLNKTHCHYRDDKWSLATCCQLILIQAMERVLVSCIRSHPCC